MRLVLLGGAPGVGKSTVAHHVLEEVFRSGAAQRVQWIDVEMLWRHQPWEVSDRTTTMLHRNLRAVLASASAAEIDTVIVTWIFHSAEQHALLRELAPPRTPAVTVQLIASVPAWRTRFEGDPRRHEVDRFNEHVYAEAQSVDVDHRIDTTGLDPDEVARVLARFLELGNR